MLPSNYVNEWLSEPSINVFNLLNFIDKQFKRARKDETIRESKLSVGSRIHAVMNAICIGLELKGFAKDHVICWGEDWMSLSIIINSQEKPFGITWELPVNAS